MEMRTHLEPAADGPRPAAGAATQSAATGDGRRASGARPVLYVVILLAVFALAFAAKLRTRGVFACPAAYGGKAYLSDCNAAGYGDFDHGAFLWGLEPKTREAARNARVLFLGNSRVQFGFSSPVTVRWFEERKIPFFSLGFSHYESVTFFTPVLAQVQPQASAYVINADRFFAEWTSPASQRVLFERDARSRYEEKRFWQGVHRPLCGALPVLCGSEFAVYRTVANGTWFTAGTPPHEPKATADGEPSNVDRWPHYVDLAKSFLAGLKVDRSCIVLTIVPSVTTKRAEAQAIADALGLPLIAPQVEGLTTFDGSHLDVKSAGLWSAAFLQAAGPVLERCAGARSSADASKPGGV